MPPVLDYLPIRSGISFMILAEMLEDHPYASLCSNITPGMFGVGLGPYEMDPLGLEDSQIRPDSVLISKIGAQECRFVHVCIAAHDRYGGASAHRLRRTFTYCN